MNRITPTSLEKLESISVLQPGIGSVVSDSGDVKFALPEESGVFFLKADIVRLV